MNCIGSLVVLVAYTNASNCLAISGVTTCRGLYVRRGEAAASGRQATGGATEFIQNYICNLLFNFD